MLGFYLPPGQVVGVVLEEFLPPTLAHVRGAIGLVGAEETNISWPSFFGFIEDWFIAGS